MGGPRLFLPPDLCYQKFTKCPWQSNSFNTSNKNTTFCVVSERMKEVDSKINIVVLGGSMTDGHEANGCCCTENIDSRCSNINSNFSCVIDQEFNRHYGNEGSTVCRWSFMFHKWFESIAPLSTVVVHSLALSGHTSEKMAIILGEVMKNRNIPMLTGSDIVFIDHSVNDGFSLNTEEEMQKLAVAVEKLLLEIYDRSSETSLPQVILLQEDLVHNPERLRIVYEAVAAKYQIPLWSFVEAVMSVESNFSKIVYSQAAEAHFPWSGGQGHVPWHMHLLYADFIATRTLMEIEKCFGLKSNYHSIVDLPRSITSSCRRKDRILSFFAQGFYSDTSKTTEQPIKKLGLNYGNSSVIRWELQVDHPGKPAGWIYQTSEQNCINDTLSFNIKTVQDYALKEKQVSNYSILVEYLQTYEGAGAVDISICGNILTRLYALRDDWNTSKISTAESTVISFNASATFLGCAKIPPSLDFTNVCTGATTTQKKFKLLLVSLCRNI